MSRKQRRTAIAIALTALGVAAAAGAVLVTGAHAATPEGRSPQEQEQPTAGDGEELGTIEENIGEPDEVIDAGEWVDTFAVDPEFADGPYEVHTTIVIPADEAQE